MKLNVGPISHPLNIGDGDRWNVHFACHCSGSKGRKHNRAGVRGTRFDYPVSQIPKIVNRGFVRTFHSSHHHCHNPIISSRNPNHYRSKFLFFFFNYQKSSKRFKCLKCFLISSSFLFVNTCIWLKRQSSFFFYRDQLPATVDRSIAPAAPRDNRISTINDAFMGDAECPQSVQILPRSRIVRFLRQAVHSWPDVIRHWNVSMDG